MDVEGLAAAKRSLAKRDTVTVVARINFQTNLLRLDSLVGALIINSLWERRNYAG